MVAMIGSVRVAFMAASVTTLPGERMRATLAFRSSASKVGSRSGLKSAYLSKIAKSRPSEWPKSCRPTPEPVKCRALGAVRADPHVAQQVPCAALLGIGA